MKTKFYWVALLVSAAMIAQANASDHHGGAGGSGGSNVVATAPAPASSGPVSSGRSAPMPNSAGRVMTSSNQRSHQPNINSSIPIRGRQVGPGAVSRVNNPGSHGITTPRREVNNRTQVRSGNNLPSTWRNHVVAQHSASWQRNWDRGRDHWWHGHHCRFVNGSWFIFDFGFYPWSPFWYPGSYYPYYSYYPYGYRGNYYYDTGAYRDEQYYNQDSYADPYADSTVAGAQERLAQEGYYRGEIDGVLGPQTRRAIATYQRNHGLTVTGHLTTRTIEALGLREIASD
jgi:hypothetical protein